MAKGPSEKIFPNLASLQQWYDQFSKLSLIPKEEAEHIPSLLGQYLGVRISLYCSFSTRVVAATDMGMTMLFMSKELSPLLLLGCCNGKNHVRKGCGVWHVGKSSVGAIDGKRTKWPCLTYRHFRTNIDLHQTRVPLLLAPSPLPNPKSTAPAARKPKSQGVAAQSKDWPFGRGAHTDPQLPGTLEHRSSTPEPRARSPGPGILLLGEGNLFILHF